MNQIPARFSDLVKGVFVDFVDSTTPGIEWRKPPSMSPCDGFEIHRTGDKDVAVKICIFLENEPERYKVSTALADLLNINGMETQSGVLQRLWAYVKTNKLHDNEDKRVINCDSELATVFGQPKIMLPQLGELIGARLVAPDPVVIDYVVKLSSDIHESPLAYDVEVDLDLKKHKPNLLSTPVDPEVTELNDRLVDVIRDLDSSLLRRDFFLNYSQDPVNFINNWIAGQSEDLQVILGDGNVNLEEIRHSPFYAQSFVEDGVLHYLQQYRN
jgi:SWI/SNF-related matrix-associated actin-dependent regulator of chromatin subfamily D